MFVVSQFTLYADVRKGRRSFWNAARARLRLWCGGPRRPVGPQVLDALDQRGHLPLQDLDLRARRRLLLGALLGDEGHDPGGERRRHDAGQRDAADHEQDRRSSAHRGHGG